VTVLAAGGKWEFGCGAPDAAVILQLFFQKICIFRHIQPVYMIKTKVALLERRIFFRQSKLFENFSNCSDWLDKSRSSKKATFVLIMVNRLILV